MDYLGVSYPQDRKGVGRRMTLQPRRPSDCCTLRGQEDEGCPRRTTLGTLCGQQLPCLSTVLHSPGHSGLKHWKIGI